MTKFKTPQLADLYHLGEQIEHDKSEPVASLRERDHKIGEMCTAQDDATRLLFWLRTVRPGQAIKQKQAFLSEASLALLARLVALVLGFVGMTTFLLASGRGLVNVFVFMLLFIVVQVVFCFISALLMWRASRGNSPAVLPLNPARFVISRAFPDKRYLGDSQSVVRLLLLRYGQEFGAIFTLGAVSAFFVVLALSDFTFVWGSTFDVSDGFVRRYTELLATPWTSFLPAAELPAEVISATRYHPALIRLDGASLASMRGWWPFLAMAMLTYALLPRILLWLLSRLLYRQSMRRSLLVYPGTENVLARMKSPVVRTQANQANEAGRGRVVGITTDDSLVLLNWAGALDAAELTQYEGLCAVPGANVFTAGAGSLADDRRCQQQIEGCQPEQLLVGVKSWEPPMADLKDFLSALTGVRRCKFFLVPLPGRSVPERNLEEWSAFARELPIDIVGAQGLERL